MSDTRELLHEAFERAARFIESLPERRVDAERSARELAEVLGGALPVKGLPPTDILVRLDEIGVQGVVASAGPRYFGFVTGGALPASLAASWLAAAWDQNAFSEVSSPIGTAIEGIAERWVLDALDLPRDAGVAFVTGATMANFTALAAARRSVLLAHGHDVDRRGLHGAPEVTVVVGEEAHATLHKALGMLGLGRDRVVPVPADDQGRMRADALPHVDGPAIVCTQEGNVNSGAFDPIGVVCDSVRADDVWVHVDGAFGLWAKTSRARCSGPRDDLGRLDEDAMQRTFRTSAGVVSRFRLPAVRALPGRSGPKPQHRLHAVTQPNDPPVARRFTKDRDA